LKKVRSFQILNHLIKIRYQKLVHDSEKGDLCGDCLPDDCLLKVSTSPGGTPAPDSTIEHSRWHEQVHLMFHFAGRTDLYEDEGLVDALAGYLAQYEATVKRR
jgi:hypothetical protein